MIDDLVARALAAPPRCGATRLVCVDGPSGAGKTQLAARLANALGDPPLLHMDDLYPGWDGLAAGVALLRSGVIAPLATGHPARYRRWDWGRSAYAECHDLGTPPLLVIEGVGAGAVAALRSAATGAAADATALPPTGGAGPAARAAGPPTGAGGSAARAAGAPTGEAARLVGPPTGARDPGAGAPRGAGGPRAGAAKLGEPAAAFLIWLDAPEAVRRCRAMERDGATYAPHWARWAAQERAHFAADRTLDRADVALCFR